MVCRNSLRMASMTSLRSTRGECCGAAANARVLQKPQPPKHLSLFRFNISIMEGYQKFVGEMLGTALLLFGGCMGCLQWNNDVFPYTSAVSFGLVVMILIQTYGHISGAHFNPAVTIAAVVFRLVSIPVAILYIFAQMIGALIGYRCLTALTPTKVLDNSVGAQGFCQTAPHEDLNDFEVFILEYIATMMLISLCCACWDKRNSKNQDSVALKFGFAICVLSIIFGPFTGCSMNPARTFAPAFWTQNYPSHWVYWIAPSLSGLVTSIVYKLFFVQKEDIDFEAAQPLQQDDLPKV